ncbi:hypothetical protein SAMN05216184_1024 [Georgenia satyanarayanai]|uniref:Uncharacterized protein n=1 Tax=Georgenia satyanarayanai TaxID=860221 RepID=A0A2Y9A944_9MICO|nr:hypothetical protein A8987_1024 [Georgenia satyanarayanai]SSA39089.1 hypothetical protein SAMN05216184_1024 [Georgenia satyanarayanai]
MTFTRLARPTATGMALALSMTLGACASENDPGGPERTPSGTTSAPSSTGNPTAGDRTGSPGLLHG